MIDAGHPQAEAGAALALGREKRLAQAPLHFRRNAAAVVSNGDADAANAGIAPAAGAANADPQSAVRRRGLDGVGDQIREHLTHFARIDQGFFRAVVLALDAQILLHHAPAVEREDFFQQLVDVGADRAPWSPGKS